MTRQSLIINLRRQFRLDWHGIHGASHWARVKYHGVSLARDLGLDTRIPSLFAVIHDSQRRNDDHDPEHGPRAAEYADWLWHKGWIDLEPAAMQLLIQACEEHSDGHVDADPVVQVCWDADRLDLGRVGIRPDARYLCTDAAKDPNRIERAWRWSCRQRVLR